MRIDIEGMDDLLKYLDKMSDKGKVDNIAKRAVNEAKGAVASAMKSAINASERGAHYTGDVSASVKPTDAKVNSYGVYSVARPTGHHRSGARNGEVAAYLEYGTSRLQARPWRSKATAIGDAKAKPIIEKVLKSELELE